MPRKTPAETLEAFPCQHAAATLAAVLLELTDERVAAYETASCRFFP